MAESVAIFAEKVTLLTHKQDANVVVTKESVRFTWKAKNGGLLEVHFKDVIGCSTNKDKEHLCINLYAYPLKKNKFGKRYARVKKKISFILDDNNTFDKTYALEKKLQKLLRNLDLECENIPVRKPLMVFVNPVSGKGQAQKVYKHHVEPMLNEANIDHTLIVTERQGHAFDTAKDMDISQWSGIVVVSGDGLLFEVINGLMEREDWEQAIKTPLGTVSGGSGNALVASVIYQTTGHHHIDNAATMSTFEICKGKVKPLDLVSVETPSEQSVNGRGKISYSFLFVIVGLIADIDIESEKLRFLGGDVRESIYGVLRIGSFRKYPAKVSFHRCDKDTLVGERFDGEDNTVNKQRTKQSLLCTPLLEDPIPSDWASESGEYVQILAGYLSHIAIGKMVSANAKLSDGVIRLNTVGKPMSRLNLIKLWESIENGEGCDVALQNRFSADCGAKLHNCDMFRVVPENKHSNMFDVDGERFPMSSFQGQIHRGLARVFTSS